MGDPLLLVAVIGLGLSALASAIRLIDWFLHSDPKAIAHAGRWAAVGLAILSVPLLFGLLLTQRWTAAISLSAVMLLAFAFYGPRLARSFFPQRLVPDWSPPKGAAATPHTIWSQPTPNWFGARLPYWKSICGAPPAFPNRTEPMEERSARSLPGAANPITATATTATARPGRCPKRKLWISSALALMRRTRRSTTRIGGWRNWSIRTAAARITSP